MNNRKLGIGLILCSLLMGGFFLSRPSQKPGDIATPSGKSTIDPKLMNACQLAFPKGKFGAIVVIDPRNGHVLADFSTPDPTAEDQRELSETPTQPGVSLFPIVALSGSPSNVDERKFDCRGGTKFGSKFMKCWISSLPEKAHGELGVADGLFNSCNSFIHQYGAKVGISNILITADHFGIMPKSRLAARNLSNIPDPEWLKWQGMQWSPAFTAMVAVGQGATEVSPLQMAMIYSTFANGGVVYEPNWDPMMASKVTTDFGTLPQYKQATFDLLRETFRASVNDPAGKGNRAKSADFVIAGQTGTVLTGNPKIPVNAWFCGFAPFENPTVAVAVFVKNGVSGNSTAAPIAREVLEFALKNSPTDS